MLLVRGVWRIVDFLGRWIEEDEAVPMSHFFLKIGEVLY